MNIKLPVYLRLVLLTLLLHTSNLVEAQTKKESFAAVLEDAGFENVAVVYKKTDLLICFENRVDRFKADGLIRAVELVAPLLTEDTGKVSFVLLSDNIPITKFSVSGKTTKEYFNHLITPGRLVEEAEISTDTDEEWSELADEAKSNKSQFKFDIAVRPFFKAEFGDYDNPVKDQINLIPAVATSLWPGMKIIAETIFPVHNEFPGEGDYIRPGILSINQVFRFKNDYFVAASAGYFTRSRYGLNFETRKFFDNGNFAVGAEAGYTGYASIYKNILLYSPLYLWTGCLNLSYRLNKYDLTFSLTAGKFIYEDESIRFDISRQFGEISIGFFAIKSKGGDSNGGFNFSVPLFPSKYWKPGFVRIRPSEDFSWEYKVRGLTPGLAASQYDTGIDLKLIYDMLNPGFIKNYYNRN